MAEKQKSEMLSVEQKYAILQLLEKRQSRKNIAKKYDISIATVGYIHARRKEIKRYFETNPVIISRFTKRVPSLQIMDLEKVLYHWCVRCIKNNIEITGAGIQKKALELNRKLNGDNYFRASGYWVQNFRDRHSISQADMKKDFPTPTKVAAENFKDRFNVLLRDEGFTLENVYDVGYTAIMWKAVPEGTLIFHRANSTASQKMCEDHVTSLLCTNATGCHKLPVLIVGRIMETERTYHFNPNSLQTIYTANANAWINSSIFNLWFEECFLESVKKRQEKNGRREKTLLLLDHARSLPDLNDLNKKDEFVTVISLPRDVTPLRQPMNCGIIASFKRIYRKQLLRALSSLQFCNTEDEVIEIHNKLNTWDCCRMVDDAWSYVDNTTITEAWDSILSPDRVWCLDSSQKIKTDADETLALLRTLPGCEQHDAVTVSNWFVIDITNDIVTKIYTDEVLRHFGNDTLEEAYKNIVDDEAGPSRPKILRLR